MGCVGGAGGGGLLGWVVVVAVVVVVSVVVIREVRSAKAFSSAGCGWGVGGCDVRGGGEEEEGGVCRVGDGCVAFRWWR